MPDFFSFRFQDRYFSSPNRTAPPPGLTPPVALPIDPTPSQLKKQLWSSNRYPYIAFILRTPFHGDLLSVLSTPASKVPIIQHKGVFHPPSDQAKKWKQLEIILQTCCKELTALYSDRHRSTSLPLTVPHLPSHYGYYTSHPTEAEVRDKLQQSFDAFEIYIAYLSFLICICEFPRDGSKPLPWKDRLRQAKVHRECLNLLFESPIVDFGRERQGTVMDVSSINWAIVAQIFPKASVPLWLYWGDNPLFAKMITPWVKAFRPNASAPVFNLPSASANPSQASTPPHQESAAPFPPVQPFCGQKPGETMVQFFTRRWKANQERRQKETGVERKAREMREDAMKRWPEPGKKGPAVYRWELVDGHRIRHAFPRNRVRNEWDGFGRRELIYDGFHNTWDICSDYGDETFEEYFSKIEHIDADSESESDSGFVRFTRNTQKAQNDSTDDTSPQSPPPSSEASASRFTLPSQAPLPLSTLPVPTPITTESNLEQTDPAAAQVETSASQSMCVTSSSISSAAPEKSEVNPPTHDAGPLSTTTPTDSEEIDIDIDITDQDLDATNINKVSSSFVVHLQAFHPVTFTTPQLETLDELLYYHYGYLASSSPHTRAANISQSFHSWREIARTVGGRLIEGSEAARERIAAFLGLIIESATPLDTVGDLWDLDHSSTGHLDLQAPSSLTIEKRQLGDIIEFFLRPAVSSSTSSYILAVDAATALDAFRRRLGPSVEDAAKFLITRGIPFRSFRSVPFVPRYRPPPPLSLPHLGSRSYKYIFDLADYAVYTKRRNDFLRGTPRARVALRMGGIIGRLARQVLQTDLGASGPSLTAIQGKGIQVRCGRTTLVDDDLTSDEIDLIVGTYHLEPDKNDEDQQGYAKAVVSWFPRRDIWFDSGLNVGQWTQECEVWFQDRILDIQDSGQPLPQKIWRNKIRKNRLAPKLVHSLNNAASAFLDRHLNFT